MKKQFENFWRYRYLLYELVKKGIKLKYRRSYLGIIWSLLEPIMSSLVLAVVFSTLLAKNDPTFPLYVVSGRLLLSFFTTGTKGALRSIRQQSGMIKKLYVPKYLYPLSTILYNYVIFLISLIVLVVFGIGVKVYPCLNWLKLVFPLAVLLLLVFGVGMILATAGVFFRDLEYLWDVMCTIIFYCSAIMYPPERLLASGYAFILDVNPIYAIICNTRHILWSEPLEWNRMFFAIGFAVICTILGLLVFRKKQDDFILHI